MNKFVTPLIGIMIAYGCFHVFSQDTTQTTNSNEIPAYLGETFKLWMKSHNKSYTSEAEFKHRLSIFVDNYNALPELRKTRTHQVGLTKFSDLTTQEFLTKYGGVFPSQKPIPTTFRARSGDRIAASSTPVDHSTKIVEVKDQASCGSCWAFSSNAALEFAYNTANRVPAESLVSLSEQELVDCCAESHGCNGGMIDFAMEYVKSQGLTSEEAYPYLAKNGKCNTKDKPRVIGTKDMGWFIDVPAYDGVELEKAVSTNIVAITVDATDLKTYVGGVITFAFFNGINHGVAIVGYGTDSVTGIDYFKIRNSWGTGWGESGYFRVARDTNVPGIGVMGIRTNPTYPIIYEHQD